MERQKLAQKISIRDSQKCSQYRRNMPEKDGEGTYGNQLSFDISEQAKKY